MPQFCRVRDRSNSFIATLALAPGAKGRIRESRMKNAFPSLRARMCVCVNGQERDSALCVCVCKTADLSGVQNDFIESANRGARLDARAEPELLTKQSPQFATMKEGERTLKPPPPSLDWRFLSAVSRLQMGKITRLACLPACLPDVWRFKLPFLSRPK